MRKLLLVLLAAPLASFAGSIDMSTLSCKGPLNSATTLQYVQDNCVIKKQEKHKGLYEVEFIDDATKKTVTCYFAKNSPTAVLNSCKS